MNLIIISNSYLLRTSIYSLQSSSSSPIQKSRSHCHHTAIPLATPNGALKAPVVQPTNLAETSRSTPQQPHHTSYPHSQRPEYIRPRDTSQYHRSYNPRPNPVLGKQTYQMNRFLDEVPDFRCLAVREGVGERGSKRVLRWKDALRKRVGVLEDRIGVL